MLYIRRLCGRSVFGDFLFDSERPASVRLQTGAGQGGQFRAGFSDHPFPHRSRCRWYAIIAAAVIAVAVIAVSVIAVIAAVTAITAAVPVPAVVPAAVMIAFIRVWALLQGARRPEGSSGSGGNDGRLRLCTGGLRFLYPENLSRPPRTGLQAAWTTACRLPDLRRKDDRY